MDKGVLGGITEQLKELVTELEEAQQGIYSRPQMEGPKPIVDNQGRILSVPLYGSTTLYIVDHLGEITELSNMLNTHEVSIKGIEAGSAFISELATQAEVARRKFIQQLRGMDGYTSEFFELWYHLDTSHRYYLGAFPTKEQRDAAQKLLTPEIEDAFKYKESE